jgi:hypothetical protein
MSGKTGGMAESDTGSRHKEVRMIKSSEQPVSIPKNSIGDQVLHNQ